MKEVTGNLWTYPADVRVITTNGTVKKNGECVMGRGCAAEAKQKWPRLPRELGRHLTNNGNVPMDYGITNDGNYLFTFPVKQHWHQRADTNLIRQSAVLLVDHFNNYPHCKDFNTVVLPRPGCGNGGLKWEDVRPVLEPILDDRFHVITFK